MSLARAVLDPHSNDEDALLFMILLHNYEIHLKPGIGVDDVVSDGTRPIVLAAITQRDVAEIAAELFPGDATRNNYVHWYHAIVSIDPNAIPAGRQERFEQMVAQLLLDPRIAAVEEEM